MSRGTSGILEILEAWRSTAFLLGGCLWLLDTTLLSVEVLADVSILGTPGPVNPMLYVSGTVVASIGLLGLYPALRQRVPRLAVLAAGLLAISGATLTVLLGWFIVTVALDRPAPPGVLLGLAILGLTLGVILYGATAVWTDTPSRLIGALLLALTGSIVAVMVLSSLLSEGSTPEWASPAIGGAVSVCLLAISFRLRGTHGDGATGASRGTMAEDPGSRTE